MQRKLFVITATSVVAVGAALGGLTYAISGTQSTTALDDTSSTVTVDGHKALSKNIVEGRTQSKYHPLPWIGTALSSVNCPTGLKAVTGTTMTCTGTSDSGSHISIPVTVVKASDTSITWKFAR